MTQELQTTNPSGALPAAAYIATQKNAATVRGDLNKIARIFFKIADKDERPDDWQRMDWTTLNAANVSAIFQKIPGAPATRNRALSVLKGVAKAAWRLELLSSETLARIADVKGDSGSREIEGRHIEPWEISDLMRSLGTLSLVPDRRVSYAAIRDTAIIAIAIKTGARREELASIRHDDMHDEGDAIRIQIIGKRNKQRTLFVDNGALQALRAWLVLNPEDEFLFVGINRGGNLNGNGMSSVALHQMLEKRVIEAGLKDISWHDFRRTFAGSLLDAGEDIATVAALMGHASVVTTARYDRRPEQARRKAAKKISVPYFGATLHGAGLNGHNTSTSK